MAGSAPRSRLGHDEVTLTGDAAKAFWKMLAWSGWVARKRTIHGQASVIAQYTKMVEALHAEGFEWEELT